MGRTKQSLSTHYEAKPGKSTGSFSKRQSGRSPRSSTCPAFQQPSIAFHHLEQLRELGLVQKQEIGGHYSLVSEVKIGVLRHLC